MKRIVYYLLTCIILISLAGCFEGPTGPAGPQGDKGENGSVYINQDQLTSWGYYVNAVDVVKKKDRVYTVTVASPDFCLGYWYDIWVVGIDAQFHVDTFTDGSDVYGFILLKPGQISFDYTFDLTGYALLILTNKDG